jgi:endonuclease YncB( thermonuclease family)
MGTAEGKISFEWLKTQVQGAVVTLITIKAKNTSKTDIYGRYIGFIKLRERDINKELISLGYAEARYY